MRGNISDVGRLVLDEIIANAPEKSGLMKRSFVLDVQMIGGTALALRIEGTHYAYYQDHGFMHRQAGWVEGKHFCRNAFQNHRQDFMDAVVRSVEEAVIHE
jgi:hypothetical protein